MNTLQDVYITGTGSYLPGAAVDNDHIESVLGLVGGRPSRFRRRILKSNGIERRHYAIGADGKPNQMSEEMAELAIRNALSLADRPVDAIDMLAVGTTIPDILAPGIASQVHGRLGVRAMDIASCHGICGAGAAALKSAWLNLRAGEHQCAVAAAVERPSAILRGERFEKESELPAGKRANGDYVYFNADFLRWMLSDGAGAAVLQTAPDTSRPSLRIDWIDTQSFAHKLPVCMTLGTDKGGAIGIENTWTYDLDSAESRNDKFLLRQDTQLLEKGIVVAVGETLAYVLEKRSLDVHTIDHFLPHISSYFFAETFLKGLEEVGHPIPEEKWFTNLRTKGNTGAASIFIMLDEAVREQRFQVGDNILLMIPESGRFSATYVHLTCVKPPQ